MYDCVILAGGFGKRLHPITEKMPKPLAEIGGVPAVEHVLRSVSKLPVSRCALTLMFEGEQIKKRLGKSFSGLKLDYYTENEPLGTAGGVKRAAASFTGEYVIVLSADGVFDFDLSPLLEFHKEKNAAVTVCTYYSEDPTEYGTLICDGDSRILRLCEKAPWSKTVTGRINTGIYVIKRELLALIPDGRPFDFAKDFFPMLLAEGKPMYAKSLEGYWCDVGSLSSLYRCNRDALENKLSLSLELDPCGNAVSDEASLGEGSYIRDSTVGRFVTVGDGSRIEKSFVFEGAHIGKNCVVSDCIIGKNARVKDYLNLKGVALGAGGSSHQIDSTEGGYLFTAEGVRVSSFLGEEGLLRLGAAIATVLEGVPLGVCYEEGARGASELLCEGACLVGGQNAVLLGKSFPAQSAFAAYSYSLGACALVSREFSHVSVRLYDNGALPICYSTERAVANALTGRLPERKDFTPRRLSGLSVRYTDALMKSVCSGGLEAFSLEGLELGISEAEHYLPLKTALTLLDAKVCPLDRAKEKLSDSALLCRITDGGFGLSVEYRSRMYPLAQIRAVLAKDCAERGEYDLCAAYAEAPEFQWADERLRVDKYSQSPEGGRESLARLAVRRKLWTVDASFALMRLAAVIKLSGEDTGALFSRCPGAYKSEAEVPCIHKNRTRIMDALMESGATDGREGALIRLNGGLARVSCNREESLRVVSYATSMEASRDLCDIVIKKIKEVDI